MENTVEVSQIQSLEVKKRAGDVLYAREAKKAAKEMLDSFLENDDVYRALDKSAKDAARMKRELKAKLLSTDSGQGVLNQYEKAKGKLSDAEMSLSDALEVNVIEKKSFVVVAPDGEITPIKKKLTLSVKQLRMFE